MMELPGLAGLFAAIVFGAIGFAAFLYGRKTVSWRPMLIGIALMVFPYLIEQDWLLYLTGAGLTSALFVFRD